MPSDTFRPYCDSFSKTKNDDKIALSIEDIEFLSLMDKEQEKDCERSWTAPLPFKKQRQQLPNNRPQALKRAKILADNLRRNPVKRRHFTEFMEGIFTPKDMPSQRLLSHRVRKVGTCLCLVFITPKNLSRLEEYSTRLLDMTTYPSMMF